MRWFIFFTGIILASTPLEAPLLKNPPNKPAVTNYKDLICTDEDKACIHEIISTVGETGKLSLYFKQDHLEELGERINHLHPLKFLSTIFSDPYLKTCMISVWGDYFKRGRFMGGLVPNLNREADNKRLHYHIQDFAEEIKVDPNHIRPFFDHRDWENLVYFLIYGTN